MNGCIKEELNIEQIHKATLGIVEKLIEICDKINVNYYVAYGSLIGVVRHKGFIPWDDDFDVVMLRDDYEKFCDYCIKNENKLKPFKLLSRKCEKKYPYNIARLNNMNYKAVYDNVQGYESGIFIDIYPLDGAGSDVDKVLKKVEKKKSNLFRITLWSIDDHYTKSTYNKWYRSIIKYFVRGYSKVRGAKHFLDKMENFKNLYDMDFENLKVKVPIGYDDFLRCHYGDYMKFPPKEEQVPHHEYKVYQR